MAYFGDVVRPPDLAMLAWMLEDGSRLFYERMGRDSQDDDAQQLFQSLAKAEVSHERPLPNSTKVFPGAGPVEDGLPSDRADIMEGGIKVSEALRWARGKDVTAILEFAISLETNAYDLYLKMERRLEGDAKKVFLLLAEEEKAHLGRACRTA